MRRLFPLITSLFVPIVLLLAVLAVKADGWLYTREKGLKLELGATPSAFASPLTGIPGEKSSSAVWDKLDLTRGLPHRSRGPRSGGFITDSDEDSPGSVIYYHPLYVVILLHLATIAAGVSSVSLFIRCLEVWRVSMTWTLIASSWVNVLALFIVNVSFLASVLPLPENTYFTQGFYYSFSALLINAAIASLRTYDVLTRRKHWGGLHLKDRLGLSEIRMQLLLVELLLVGYLIVTSGMFAWAESWGYDDSLYFCVVTFTTIGFGDFSPQTALGRIFVPVLGSLGIALFAFIIWATREVFLESFTINLGEQYSILLGSEVMQGEYTERVKAPVVGGGAQRKEVPLAESLENATGVEPQSTPLSMPARNRRGTVSIEGPKSLSGMGTSLRRLVSLTAFEPTVRRRGRGSTDNEGLGVDADSETSPLLLRGDAQDDDYPSPFLSQPVQERTDTSQLTVPTSSTSKASPRPPRASKPLAIIPPPSSEFTTAVDIPDFQIGSAPPTVSFTLDVPDQGRDGGTDESLPGSPTPVRTTGIRFQIEETSMPLTESDPLLHLKPRTRFGRSMSVDVASFEHQRGGPTSTSSFAGANPRQIRVSRSRFQPQLRITTTDTHIARHELELVAKRALNFYVVVGMGLFMCHLLFFGAVFAWMEGWRGKDWWGGWLEGVYFCFVALATIGYGDFVPRTLPSRSIFIAYIFLGIPNLTFLGSVLGERIVNQWKVHVRNVEEDDRRYKARKARKAVRRAGYVAGAFARSGSGGGASKGMSRTESEGQGVVTGRGVEGGQGVFSTSPESETVMLSTAAPPLMDPPEAISTTNPPPIQPWSEFISEAPPVAILAAGGLTSGTISDEPSTFSDEDEDDDGEIEDGDDGEDDETHTSATSSEEEDSVYESELGGSSASRLVRNQDGGGGRQ